MYFFHWFDGAILVRISILTSTNKSLSRAKWRNHILITLKAKWMAQVEPSVTLERYFAKNQLSSEERKALQSLKGNTYVNVKKELSSQWFFYTTSRLKTASLTTNPTDIFIPWPYLQRPRWDLLMTDLCS